MKQTQLSVIGALIVALATLLGAPRLARATESQVTICHFPPGNPTNVQVITVGQSAVPAHVAHHNDAVCPAGDRDCCFGGSNPSGCTNLQADLNNCGRCGNRCPPGGSCISGTCVTPTPTNTPTPTPTPLCNNVICTASDQCHGAGTCDPSTGQCSNPTQPDGTACNDGNACTQTDTCQGGACTGSNPITCTAADQCHIAGTCDPSIGQCSNPAKPDGTACSDGSACTQTDTCQGGACTGSNPITCTAADQCHVAGTCDPSIGQCSNPAKPNGTACNDGNACTQTDTCQAGICAGSPVVCGVSANTCVNGLCQCGTNPACAPGQQCVVGTCVCNPTSCPTGCCSGTTCNVNQLGACGAGGGVCTACNFTAADTCAAGACKCGTGPACGGGQQCIGGTCH